MQRKRFPCPPSDIDVTSFLGLLNVTFARGVCLHSSLLQEKSVVPLRFLNEVWPSASSSAGLQRFPCLHEPLHPAHSELEYYGTSDPNDNFRGHFRL